MRYAKLGLFVLITLGLLVWSGYAAVMGVIGGADGRFGAALAAAVSLLAAMWCGRHLIRSIRSEANVH